MKRLLSASFVRFLVRSALAALLSGAVAAVAAHTRPMPARAAGPTVISTDITTNTIWTLANSPYLVANPVKVTPTARLAIEPGVQIQFLQDAALQIDGGLDAIGTQGQPISFVANGPGIQWRGLRIVQPAANIRLQGVTIKDAQAGVSIEPPAQAGPGTGARVDILESLLDTNVVGVSATYGAGTAPHLTLRNSLLTNNSTGVRIDSLPSGQNLLNLSYNSFVLNGIGIQALNLSGAVRAEHQWWGATSGPQPGDSTYCNNSLPPNPVVQPPDIICGSIDATPWSIVPAGRVFLPADQEGTLTSAIGTAALGDNPLAATSVVTLTIPANTFEQPLDIVLAPRSSADLLPGQPTTLDFEIAAAANGQKIEQFAAGKQPTLVIRYTQADLGGAAPQRLTLYAFDKVQGFWSYFGIQSVPNVPNSRVFGQIYRPAHIRVSAVNFARIWLPAINK